MKKHSDLSRTRKTQLFSRLLPAGKRLRPAIGVLIVSLGLISAGAATDFCQKTSEHLLEACEENAEGDYYVALAKCENVSNSSKRADCRREAATDYNEARGTCADQSDARQAVCERLGGAPYDPVIDPKNFVTGVTNPYFPLPPGRTLVYEGQTAEGLMRDEFIITRKTKTIQGVKCIEVRDLVYLNGQLLEDTLDWFAQDKQGNVWYFGENTGELENGRFVTLDGSFTAGVNRDKAGIIMKAQPKVGDFYRQEFSLDNAEDLAEVVALNATVNVPAGTFKNCVKTLETTPIEPELLEEKYYASGVGNVLVVDLRTGEKSKLIKITTNSQ